MKERRRGRRLALDVLYESEIRDELPHETFEARRAQGWVVPAAGDDSERPPGPSEAPSDEALSYALDVIDGVQKHQPDIDAVIVSYADRWAIQRMPVVDRTLLRIALYELLWRDDIPVAVAINEAVEMAKAMSTDDSGRFINGLLGRVAEQEIET